MTGRIRMKFDMEVVLKGGGKVFGFFTWCPTPLGTGCIKRVQCASGALTVHFDKNFIKQKLLGTPDFVGAGHLFGPQIPIGKDLAPLLSFWSHGHSL